MLSLDICSSLCQSLYSSHFKVTLKGNTAELEGGSCSLENHVTVSSVLEVTLFLRGGKATCAYKMSRNAFLYIKLQTKPHSCRKVHQFHMVLKST